MPTCIKPSLFASLARRTCIRDSSRSLFSSLGARDASLKAKRKTNYYSQLQPPSPSPQSLPPPPALATTTTTTTITTLSVIPPSTLILSATARAIFFTRARWWKSQRNFSAAAASSWRGIIQIRSRARAAYAISHDATRQDKTKTRHETTRRTQCHRRITRISLSVLDQSSAEIRARAYLVAANELASRVRAREKLFCRLLWLHLVVNREQCGVSSLSSTSTSTSTSSSRGFAARCIAGCCAATTTGREPRRLLRKEPVKDRRRNTLAGECKRSVCCGGIRVSRRDKILENISRGAIQFDGRISSKRNSLYSKKNLVKNNGEIYLAKIQRKKRTQIAIRRKEKWIIIMEIERKVYKNMCVINSYNHSINILIY